MNIKEVWRSGFVRRWHSNPDLAHTGQTNGHHQWGVAVLAMHLFSDDPDLIKAAILHDVAEINIGDVSGLAKRINHNLKIEIDKAEQENANQLGVKYLTDDRLKLCDMIDAYLWAKHHAPHILQSNGWPDQVEYMFALAMVLGVDADLGVLL